MVKSGRKIGIVGALATFEVVHREGSGLLQSTGSVLFEEPDGSPTCEAGRPWPGTELVENLVEPVTSGEEAAGPVAGSVTGIRLLEAISRSITTGWFVRRA